MYVKCRIAVTKVLLNCASTAAAESIDDKQPTIENVIKLLLIDNNNNDQLQHRIDKRGVFGRNRYRYDDRKSYRFTSDKCIQDIDRQMNIDDPVLVELQQRNSFEFLNCLNTSALDSTVEIANEVHEMNIAKKQMISADPSHRQLSI